MTPSDELQNAAGAYALNAMSDAERAEFETVLAGSEQLRSEVTELMDTAVALGASVEPVDPPASLRASILDAVAKTPQLAPLETPRVEERHEATRVETQPSAPETPAELKARSRWSSPL